MMVQEDEFDLKLCEGLELLGWQVSVRFTNENELQLVPICEEAIDCNFKATLTADKIDELALQAYEVIAYQVVGVQERADFVSLVYSNSKYLKPLLNVIDEATLCFYRGYETAAIALLFITIESYLRAVHNWKPGDKDATFAELRRSVLTLPNKSSAEKAFNILNILYARYDAVNKAQFEFNRHSLLHGIRTGTEYDEMNCARIFQLLNLLCSAEGVERKGYDLEWFNHRFTIYERCGRNKLENMLTRVDWES